MKTLSERSLEHDNKVFVCFVDFEKAFDRVDWNRMVQILKQINVDWKAVASFEGGWGGRRFLQEMGKKQNYYNIN